MSKTLAPLLVPPKGLASALAAAALFCLPAIATAETIQIPVGQQTQQKSSLSRPANGMTQAEVEAVYGKPVDWHKAVGDPPISSWVYADFVVYFEYDEVIHSVLQPKQQPLARSGP